MSTPPPPGWQPQQPGQPPHNAPPYGSQPGNFATGGYPQGGWPQQPPPPKGGNTTKLLLIAIAVLLVIGVTIGATLLLTRGTGDATTNPSSTQNASDFASAGDVGPVSVITEEPTCDAFTPINDSLVKLRMQGWGDARANLGPAQSWTAQQRSLVNSVATATSNAADAAIAFAKQTPHRVVRELYEQYVAYARAYVASVADYRPADNYLASVNVNIGDALISICSAIRTGSSTRAIAVSEARQPNQVAAASDPSESTRFLTESATECSTWTQIENQLSADLGPWSQLDASVAASQWTPEQRAIQEAATPVLRRLGEQTANAAAASANPVIDDFGTLSALYFSAYVSVGTSYTEADSWLSGSALRLLNTISDACRSVGG